MTVQRHFISGPCPYCRLTLFRSPKTVAEPIIFCATATCRAGVNLKETREKGTPLAQGFVSEDQINEMLREMGTV